MCEGLRVLRGPDWPADDDRDGGEGHLGTVVSVGGEGTCEVLWDNGNRRLCRIGKLGKQDLRIFDNATIGVRHLQIVCDGCDSRGIAGMLWKCSQCKQCNLCSVCYVTDKHDLAHEFMRYDTPDSSGVKVKRRSSSLKIRAMGLFPGAVVVRGDDWNSGNIDGGAGKTGQLTLVVNSSSAPSTRNMVKVRWSSGQQGEHRVGYEGKVDIQYKEESPGTYYYKEHLPCLNADHVGTARELEILKEGDKVCIQVPANSLKAVQSQRSGWTSGMNNCIGKIGVIKAFTPSGDATVEFGGLRFRFFPGALKKVPNLNVGDVVEVQNDVEKVKMLQEGHAEWTPEMKQIMGKCGKVVKVGEDGNVVVAFGKKTFVLFSGCCTLSRGGRVHELEETSRNPSSPTESSSDAHSNLLKLMAAVMMKENLERMAAAVADPDVLYQAIGKGDVSMVKSICNKAPKLVNVNHKGVTPLILAAHEGQTEVVRALLDLGAQTTPTDGKGHTALHAALIGKKERTAQLLLDRGASAQPSNNAKRTALHFAAHANLSGIMTDLIKKGCSVNSRDLAGDTPLHDAITKGHRDATVIMLRAAKIDLALPNCRGFNPLQLACLTGNPFAVEAILKRDTSTVNLQKQQDRFSALHIAAVNDHVDCARILIDVGKAQVDIKGENSYTPLHLACHEAYIKSTELLLQKGADPNQRDEKGNTALHIAVGADKQTGGNVEHQLIAALIGLPTRNDDETRVRLACLLLQKNAILDIKNNSGRTPLECCRSQTVRQAVQLFVRQHEGTVRRSAVSTPREGVRVRIGSGLLDIALPCAKCMEKMAEVTVLPCGHKVLCRACCLKIEICPICETRIERRIAKKERVDVEEPCKVQ